MEPFNNNPLELFTFISLFLVAVVLIPFVFMKIGDFYDY